MEQIVILIILSIIILITFMLAVVKISNHISERQNKRYKKYYAGKIIIHSSSDISTDNAIKIAKENDYKSFNC